MILSPTSLDQHWLPKKTIKKKRLELSGGKRKAANRASDGSNN
jgi:hypothetical protein